MADAGGLAADLAVQVDVHRVVDGHEVIDGRDGADIVHIADRRGHAHAVVVQKVIDPLAAGGEGIGLAAMVDALVGAADLAAQGQIHEGLHIHLGMDAHVAQVGLAQQHTHGIGHAADTQLETCAVGDALHHLPGHGLVDLRGRCGQQLAHGVIAAFHDHVHVGDMYALTEAAQAAGHVLVDLHDDDLRRVADGLHVGRGNAEVEVAVLIHGAHLDQGHIRRIDVIIVVAGQLGIAHGLIEAGAGVDMLALKAAGVVGVIDNMLGRLLDIEDGGLPQGDAAADLHILQLRGAACQRLIQNVGMGVAEAIVYPVAGLDHFNGFVCRGQLGLIHTQKFFVCHFYMPPVFFLFYPWFSLWFNTLLLR